MRRYKLLIFLVASSSTDSINVVSHLFNQRSTVAPTVAPEIQILPLEAKVGETPAYKETAIIQTGTHTRKDHQALTKQTKHLIELSDVKAVVLECKNCVSSVSFSFARIRSLPQSCPACGHGWDQSSSPTRFNEHVEEYMRFHRKLQEAIQGDIGSSVGCTMALEVDVEEPSKERD
jgi:hypothetical protein